MSIAAESAAPLAASPASVSADRMLAVRLWLWSVAALVFLMVIVGGATRLTDSGLSITEWRVITGTLPPLTQAAWLAEFDKYKQIPQFHHLFPLMTLSEFKFIYYWEWGHRFLGRLIGLAFALPLAYFWATGRVTGTLRWKLLGLLALGGLQGAVGWWMVTSGLAYRTEVAPERLAVHLFLASLTFMWLITVALSLRPAKAAEAGGWLLRSSAGWLVAFILAQVVLGAFVAGSRAGLTYNTWPLMDGAFMPPLANMMVMEPGWRNFFENTTTVQFQHRIGAYLLLAFALFHAWRAHALASGTAAVRRAYVVVGLIVAQAVIGITTLLLAEGRIPIFWGLLHQGFAFVVLGMAVVHWRRLASS